MYKWIDGETTVLVDGYATLDGGSEQRLGAIGKLSSGKRTYRSSVMHQRRMRLVVELQSGIVEDQILTHLVDAVPEPGHLHRGDDSLRRGLGRGILRQLVEDLLDTGLILRLIVPRVTDLIFRGEFQSLLRVLRYIQCFG